MDPLEGGTSGNVGPQVIFIMDSTGRCTLSVGPGLEALGLEQNELVGQDLFAVYTNETAHAAFRRVLGGETFAVERQVQERALWTFWQPLLAADGTTEGAIGVTTDLTAHREAQTAAETARRRVVALADLSTALSMSVDDLEAMLPVSVRSATELTADFGALWLRGAADLLEPRVVWHRDSEIRDLLRTATEELRGRSGRHDLAAVEDLRGPQQFGWSLEDLEGEGTAGAGGLIELTRRLGPQAAIRVPLRSRGRVVGFMDLARGADQGPFEDDDIRFIVDIVDRCALALDNALLWREQREAREDLVKFKALADASHELIQITDTDEDVVYVNPRLDDLQLWTPGGDLWANVSTAVGAETMQSLRAAVEGATRWAGEVSLPSEHGTNVVQGEVFPLYHPQTSSRLGTAWMARDITGLRSSESALRATNAELVRFRALVDNSPDFIAIAGLDGAVRYVNPAGRALLDLDPDIDVTQTTITDYLTPEGIEASLRVEQPAVIAHGRWEGQSTLRHRSGRAIQVAITSFLMNDPETGAPFALATVQRDITQRLAAEQTVRRLGRQREALLERLVEAEARERAMIAADVHDDSVQAMAAVDLRLELFERLVRHEAPTLLEPLRAVQDAVSGATQRLRVLLFDLEEPDLDEGLGAALGRAAEHIFAGSATRIRVEGNREPPVPDALRTVGFRIAREALVNAFKHAQATHVDISVTGAVGGLQVVVADDGIGISEQTMSSPPGHYGLSGMSDRAEVLGGTCQIGSADPHGTVITIWLPGPLSEPAPGPAEAADRSSVS